MHRGAVAKWVESIAHHTKPARVHYCDGSDREIRGLEDQMVREGTLIRLNQAKYPGCFLHRSAPTDVARSERQSYLVCADREEAGPTNNWMSASDASEKVWSLFASAMAGRT